MILGGVFVGLGGLFTAVFLAVLLRWLQISRRAVEVSAEVVGVEENGGEPDPIYGGGGGGHAPVVRFRTADGEVVTATASTPSSSLERLPPVGTTIKARYDPTDPQKIHIRGLDLAVPVLFSGCLITGVVFLCAGVSLLLHLP